jgi:GNAT superfamily N-acetyltransferase
MTGETPAIQRLRVDHVGKVKALIREVWRENFGAHPQAFVRDFLLTPRALDDIDKAAAEMDGNCLFLVQEVGGQVVATGAAYGVSEDTCELARMFVAPAWRRHGLASSLAVHLLDFARAKNFRSVRLASNKQLIASHQLYHSLGFRRCASWAAVDDGYSFYMQLEL